MRFMDDSDDYAYRRVNGIPVFFISFKVDLIIS